MVIGMIISTLLFVIGGLLFFGKSFKIEIKHTYRQEIELPKSDGSTEVVDVEKLNEDNKKPTIDNVVTALNNIMLGGNNDGNE